jgi:hypothetical protein
VHETQLRFIRLFAAATKKYLWHKGTGYFAECSEAGNQKLAVFDARLYVRVRRMDEPV